MTGTVAFVEDKGELPMLGQTYGVIPGQEGFFLGRVRRHAAWIRSVTTNEPVPP